MKNSTTPTFFDAELGLRIAQLIVDENMSKEDAIAKATEEAAEEQAIIERAELGYQDSFVDAPKGFDCW